MCRQVGQENKKYKEINKKIKNKNFSFSFQLHQPLKNVDKLQLYLDNLAYKPDIIMASKTKLKRDSLLINIEIEGYIFFHADSTTNAGGVGIYIKSKFNPCICDDVSQIHGSEYIFIKLRLKHQIIFLV